MRSLATSLTAISLVVFALLAFPTPLEAATTTTRPSTATPSVRVLR